MSIEQGYPGKVNHDDERREPVPSDTVDDTAVEPQPYPEVVPDQRKPEEDYAIPETKDRKKPSRRGALAAIGTVALAGITTAVVFIAGGNSGDNKGSNQAPEPNFETSTSAAPFETGNSQPPITAETTTVTVETTGKDEGVAIPDPLENYVLLGEKGYDKTKANELLAIHGNTAQEADAEGLKLMGSLMTGGTNPNVIAHATHSSSVPEQEKEITNHLADQFDQGVFNSFIQGPVTANRLTPLVMDSNMTAVDLIVGHNKKNVEANGNSVNAYSGGNISEVHSAGEEQVVQQGDVTVIKSKVAVESYDRTGANSTKGKLVETDSYVLSRSWRHNADGTWTMVKSSATKASNS